LSLNHRGRSKGKRLWVSSPHSPCIEVQERTGANMGRDELLKEKALYIHGLWMYKAHDGKIV